MPARGLPVIPRWPSAPYPLINGTNPTTTTEPPKVGGPQATEATPSFMPTPVYETVKVVSASSIIPETTHAPVPQYPGGEAKMLQGYCSEPAYTILEGPDMVFWLPVVGCISSKPDCCATTTTGGTGAAQTVGGGGNGNAGSGAQFPISFLPDQGALTGCPKDYHTVGSTACCPSSYWLWSTKIGGQVPCYSSLNAVIAPPPMPDTLANHITGSETRVTATTKSQKPTSAIVNIAYAMQYKVVDPPKKGLATNVKIGVGVGVSVAAICIVLVIVFLLRKFREGRKGNNKVHNPMATERYGMDPAMSSVAPEVVPDSRMYGGAKYVGVSTGGHH